MQIAGVFDQMEPGYAFDYRLQKRRRNWSCKLCSYTTFSKGHCKEHMLSKHGEVKDTPCPMCGMVFRNWPQLRRHKSICSRRQRGSIPSLEGDANPAIFNITL